MTNRMSVTSDEMFDAMSEVVKVETYDTTTVRAV